MCKKYRFEGKIALNENDKELAIKSKWGVFLFILLLLTILIPIIFVFVSILTAYNFSVIDKYEIVCFIKTSDLLFYLIIICIFTIIISLILYFSLNYQNKLNLLNKIIQDDRFKELSSTVKKYDDKGNLTEESSSDQKAKVLIAAIEAIKDL